MLRLTTLLLFTFVAGVASADVLDHHNSILARLAHQLFSPHHLPFTLLVVVVGAIALQKWRTARK